MPNSSSYHELAAEYVLLCFVVSGAYMPETCKENKYVEGKPPFRLILNL